MQRIIRFIEVGRSKRTWEEPLKRLTPDTIAMLVAKSGALKSRGIEIDLNIDTMSGSIYAGMRTVGRFEIALKEIVDA